MKPNQQTDLDGILRVASRFRIAPPTGVAELRAGHINDSYVVGTSDGARGLLQRINEHVFPQPLRLMKNAERITRHLARRLGPDSRRRRLTMIPVDDGRMWIATGLRDGVAGWWRMYELIENVTTELRASSPDQAFRAAQAFGRFQGLLTDLPPPPLFETIPHFHDTPRRYRALDRTLRSGPGDERNAHRHRNAQAEIEAAARHRGLADRLAPAAARGTPERTVHNDCKISNVLFDRESGEALCVVDLDTAMPGLAAFDFGDMARSMAHRADEDAHDPQTATVDLGMFEAVVRGYLDGACFLTADERNTLVDGALVLTLEQAVRFLTDYLEGDIYFRVDRPEQNLDRCRVQFTLLESLLDQEAELHRIVAEVAGSVTSV